jgi:adenine phosphoribosyltransferase
MLNYDDLNYGRNSAVMRNILPCICFLAGLSPSVGAAHQEQTHLVKIGKYSKQYPIVPSPGNKNVSIVYLYDVSDNFILASQAASELAKQISYSGLLDKIDVIVMPGDNANMLGTLLTTELRKVKKDLKFCIIRANAKGGSFKTAEYQPITSPVKKILHLREDQFELIKDKQVLVFDDVLSTGATMTAVNSLVKQANGKTIGYACLATEGNEIKTYNDKPLFKITHLPVLVKEG